jgi:hypothetical protein
MIATCLSTALAQGPDTLVAGRHLTPVIKARANEWSERLSRSAGAPFASAVPSLARVAQAGPLTARARGVSGAYTRPKTERHVPSSAPSAAADSRLPVSSVVLPEYVATTVELEPDYKHTVMHRSATVESEANALDSLLPERFATLG